MLSRAAGVVHEGLEIARLAESNWRNGMRPSGVLTAPAYLTDTQRKRKDAWVDDFSGAVNAGKVPLLEGGWDFKRMQISSVDAEFLGSRTHSVAEICRLFAIPEILLQVGTRAPADLAPYLSAFASQALAPLVASIEAEFDHALLPPGLHLQLDMGGLMRGSWSAVVAGACAAVQSGVMTPNDARRAMSLPALEGGDVLGQGKAPSWPADGVGLPHLGPSPGPRGDGPPEPGTHENGGSG